MMDCYLQCSKQIRQDKLLRNCGKISKRELQWLMSDGQYGVLFKIYIMIIELECVDQCIN